MKLTKKKDFNHNIIVFIGFFAMYFFRKPDAEKAEEVSGRGEFFNFFRFCHAEKVEGAKSARSVFVNHCNSMLANKMHFLQNNIENNVDSTTSLY